MSITNHGESKLIFPGLAGFYAAVSDLWYPMIRITVGAILLVHGWGKIKTGITALAAYLGRARLVPPEPLAYVVYINETIGAVCIILGLFTRFFAASIAIELAVALWLVHYAKGFGAPARWRPVFARSCYRQGPVKLIRGAIANSPVLLN